MRYGGYTVDFRRRSQPSHGARRQAAARGGWLELAGAGRAQRHLGLDDFGYRAGNEVADRHHGDAARPGRWEATPLPWSTGGTGPAPRIRILRRGEGAGGEHPARWKNLGPAGPGSRIDFVRFQIPPSTALGPSIAHAPGPLEHMHVAAGAVRVTVGDETAELAAGDSCSCRTDAPHAIENPDPSVEALIYLIVERG